MFFIHGLRINLLLYKSSKADPLKNKVHALLLFPKMLTSTYKLMKREKQSSS